MNYIACDGTWSVNQDGAPICTGTLSSVPGDQLIPAGITTEDATTLAYQSMGLFATVFIFFALKKALK